MIVMVTCTAVLPCVRMNSIAQVTWENVQSSLTCTEDHMAVAMAKENDANESINLRGGIFF